MAITMARESFGEIYPDIANLERRQWEEVGMTSLCGRSDLLPEIDTAAYFERDKAGDLICLAVRDDGVLVGYVISNFFRHSHYKSLVMSANDTHYLLPEYRKRIGLGLRMMRAAEFLQLQAPQKPDILHVHSKLAKPNDRLWKHMGYEPHDVGFIKIVRP